jgi:hypothetical protein
MDGSTILVIIAIVGFILSNQPAFAIIIGLLWYYLKDTEDINIEVHQKLEDIGTPLLIDNEPNLILILWDIYDAFGESSPLLFHSIVSKCQSFLQGHKGIKDDIRKEMGSFILSNSRKKGLIMKLTNELLQFLDTIHSSDIER